MSSTKMAAACAATAVPELELRRRELERRARKLADEREAFLQALGGAAPKTDSDHKRWVALCLARQVVELELEVAALTGDYLAVETRAEALRSASVPESVAREGSADRWRALVRRDLSQVQNHLTSLAERLGQRRTELAMLLQRAATSEEVARA